MSLLLTLLTFSAITGAEPTVGQKADLDDPVVCRKAKLPDVGTRFKPKPVCMRKSDWAMTDKQNDTELRQINQRGNSPGKAEGR